MFVKFMSVAQTRPPLLSLDAVMATVWDQGFRPFTAGPAHGAPSGLT